ncbi:carnosine N-methyltransferase-like isoform X2 [Gordionus sp. m RMFG-2023]|uniref:carnosine N-methyltransferase-like isoform X2 n=1 Tax=Gordionus sp. m RMFG-2023 TaxID=3053472 RepID=UPI0031FD3B24
MNGDLANEEKKHFFRIINAYRYYRIYSIKRLEKGKKFFDTLPMYQQKWIPTFSSTYEDMLTAINANNQFITQIIKHSKHVFQNGYDYFDKRYAKINIKAFQEISILIPGCGLGRLVYEIAKLGFTAQGNEWSLFMLLASNFILNNCKTINAYQIHPWLHQYTNNYQTTQQTAHIAIPDVNPSDIPENSNFSMSAGDFLEIYTEENAWDSVITCFFVDTAHNILDYFETIQKILKPGGYWINFGPLLYHYADMPNETSIELSYEQIKIAIIKMGFKLIKEKCNIQTGYAQNPKSMLQYLYNCVYFIAQKPK